MTTDRGAFAPDESGFVSHWLVSGPTVSPPEGQAAHGDTALRDLVRELPGTRPASPELGGSGPGGAPWRYRFPGNNVFVEQSAFHKHLEIVRMYGAAELIAPDDVACDATLWASGSLDVWVGEEHVARLDAPRYMYPSRTKIALPLKRGANLVTTSVSVLGVRDTRFLFGVQLASPPDGLTVRLPGDDGTIEAAAGWLASVKGRGDDRLVASSGAPAGVTVVRPDGGGAWTQGDDTFSLDGARTRTVAVEVAAAGETLKRTIEFPGNVEVPEIPEARSVDEHRRAYVERVGAKRRGGHSGALPVLARRLSGAAFDADTAAIADAAALVAARGDCADFILAALLRMYRLDLLTADEKQVIRETALGFRYWLDEPGSDAMCFGSENHTLLFNGCQHVAGLLFADETFTNSGRTGAEQAGIGRERVIQWLDRVEAVGFKEFLSGSYMPITVAAAMNLVDFADDAEVRRRAAAQVDVIFRMLATHCFDGVTTGPQGRVYRGVIYPHTSGAHGMLHYALPESVPGYDAWTMFVASSPGYEPPAGLADLARTPVRTTYRQADVEITLEKTDAYALSSVPVPASFDATVPPAPNHCAGLFPGMQGYQQHVWNAALARDCHVFVNHPGETCDMGSARPGYWYGNGTLPRTRQDGNVLLQVYAIEDAHPVRFTHAHWPTDAFDAHELRGHWALAERARARIALWCSAELEPFDDVMAGRELRARADRSAWVCVCASKDEDVDLAAFAARCEAMAPAFDARGLVLSMTGSVPLSFGSG